MTRISIKSIKRISVINAETGIELYCKDISSSFFLEHDNQLVSGFISALIGFSKAIVKEEIQEIVFANSRLFFKRFSKVIIVVMTTLGEECIFIDRLINDLGNQIETQVDISPHRQFDVISPEQTSSFETLVCEILEREKSTPLISIKPEKSPKIVIAGPKRAGKTTALRKFFYSWDEEELKAITPTVDYSVLHSFLDALRTELTIFDLGGQAQYIENHLTMDNRWKGAAAIIFMVDIHHTGEFQQALEYLMKIIQILRVNEEEPFIGLFAHKYDPEKKSGLKPNLQEFLRTFRKISEWPRYSIFLSSIFDESLHLAFIRTISRAIPFNLLQNILKSAIFFETQNQVWKTISSQMNHNLNTHELEEKIIDLAVPYGEKLASEILSDWLANNLQIFEVRTPNDSLNVEVLDLQGGIRINVRLPKEDQSSVTFAVIEGLFTGLGSFFGLSKINRLTLEETTDSIQAGWSLLEF